MNTENFDWAKMFNPSREAVCRSAEELIGRFVNLTVEGDRVQSYRAQTLVARVKGVTIGPDLDAVHLWDGLDGMGIPRHLYIELDISNICLTPAGRHEPVNIFRFCFLEGIPTCDNRVSYAWLLGVEGVRHTSGWQRYPVQMRVV